MKKSILRLSALLLVLLLFPVSVLGEAVDVEDVKMLESSDQALPIDFTPGPAPKEEGFSESVDENGNTVYVYEDSTIRVVASETRWFVPDEPKDKTGTQIWMADVTIADPSQLRTASTDALKKGGDHPLGDFSDSSKTEDVAKLAAVYNAVVAINGDSWGANGRNEKHNYGIVFRQGNLIDCKSKLDPAGKKRMDLLIVDENGDFHGIHSAAEEDLPDPYTVDGKKVMDIFAFGPILVENGQAIHDYQGADRAQGGTWMYMRSDEDAQRIAFCQLGPLHYLLVASAVRKSGKNYALTLPQFADFLAAQGVQFAYNLDGGQSSIIYFSGIGSYNASTGKKRPLWDMIYFATAEK